MEPRLFLLNAISATGADVGGVASSLERWFFGCLVTTDTSCSEIPVSTECGTFFDCG